MEDALRVHLREMGISSVQRMARYCREAIEACLNKEYDRWVALPTGFVQRAGDMANDYKLWGFVQKEKEVRKTA